MKFSVIYARQYTGTRVDVKTDLTLDEANRIAADFNKYSQDDSWNAVRAYVVEN